MKKEKTVKAHSRKTKSGKTVQVKQHSAKYDSADDMAKKAMLAREGAGKELAKRKKVVAKPAGEELNAEDFKAWYHWDQAGDPKNEKALKVEKCLKKKMGTKAYNKYFDELSDSYTARGHTKAFKSLDLTEGKPTPTNSKTPVEKPKSKPAGMYTKDEFLKEMKSGKIPSLAHRAEPKQVAQTAPTKDEIAKYKQEWGEDETYRTMKAEYADSKRKKPKSKTGGSLEKYVKDGNATYAQKGSVKSKEFGDMTLNSIQKRSTGMSVSFRTKDKRYVVYSEGVKKPFTDDNSYKKFGGLIYEYRPLTDSIIKQVHGVLQKPKATPTKGGVK